MHWHRVFLKRCTCSILSVPPYKPLAYPLQEVIFATLAKGIYYKLRLESPCVMKSWYIKLLLPVILTDRPHPIFPLKNSCLALYIKMWLTLLPREREKRFVWLILGRDKCIMHLKLCTHHIYSYLLRFK